MGNISPSECGNNRISHYACPESCSFNPFASDNYDQLLAFEDVLDGKTMHLLAQQPGDRVAYERALRQPQVARSAHGMHASTVWHLFFRQDSEGLTCTKRWKRAGFPGLKNDERVLIRAKMHVRVALLEVQRVLDTQYLDVVDLLEPGSTPFRLLDRSLAARAARFSALLMWAYPLPHFWRVSGTAILLPDFDPFGARDIVTATVAHLGGPTDPDPMRRWLAEHFVRFDDALSATAHERRRRVFSSMDVQWGTALYELHAPFAQCRDALDAEPRVASEELSDNDRAEGFSEARVWFDDSAAAAHLLAPGLGRRVLGTIHLGPTNWRVQASSGARLTRLKALFETRLGERVSLMHERREDFAAQLGLKEPAGDPALIVPQLAETLQKIDVASSRLDLPLAGGSPEQIDAALRQQHWQTYADIAIPALDHCTPREAARDPALRPKLIELMKRNLRQLDEENLRTGRTGDLNWLVRDLGLGEIDLPPPPPRAIPTTDEEGDFEFDEDEDGDEDFFAEDLASELLPIGGRFIRQSEPGAEPMLPPRPLDLEEASRRLDSALEMFETADAALDELKASGSTLIEDVHAMVQSRFDELDFAFLIPLLLQVWFALVPRGSRAPELDFAAMEATLEDDLKLANGWIAEESGKLLDTITGLCRQPMLLQLLISRLSDFTKRLPEPLRPHDDSLIPLILSLKAAIDEVDRALRSRD